MTSLEKFKIDGKLNKKYKSWRNRYGNDDQIWGM